MAQAHDQVRAERANELLYLQRFLNTTAKVNGTAALVDAATQCRRDKPAEDLWGYSFGGLVFEPEQLRHVLPTDAIDVRIELSMEIAGHCDPHPDPLTALSTNIVVKGNRLETGAKLPLVFSWHLDRNISEAIDGNASHPRYHFQHAGTIMRSSESFWGSAIFLEQPRLMHPPMNAFIACDFILSNFLPSARQKLALDGNYKKWLGLAQRSMWKPYAEAVVRAWGDNPCDSLCRDFWPELII
jgi:hypothetical protein